MIAGLALTHGPLAPLGFQPENAQIKALAEITLVLVLFFLALEDLGKTAEPAVTMISITVLLSVIAHDATAEPLARWYAARLSPDRTGAAHAERPELPIRKLRAHAVQEIGSRLTPRWKFDRR